MHLSPFAEIVETQKNLNQNCLKQFLGKTQLKNMTSVNSSLKFQQYVGDVINGAFN
jgi:hypothetical protein